MKQHFRWAIKYIIGCYILLSASILIALFINQDVGFLWQSIKHRVYAEDETVLGDILSSVRRYITYDPDRNVSMPISKYINSYEWLPSSKLFAIAHRLGPVMNSGDNTLDTFNKGIAAGFNIFEVDISLTTDGELVCYHGTDTTDLKFLSLNKFMQMADDNNQTALQFNDLIKLSAKYPNIYFLLDVKNQFTESYEIMDNLLAGNNRKNHFIPQVYHFNKMKWFIEHPGWGGVIFSSYISRLTTADIFYYSRLFNISAVTLTLERVAGIKKLPTDLVILTHSVNDPTFAKELSNKGVRGIYTHYLSEQTIPDLYSN